MAKAGKLNPSGQRRGFSRSKLQIEARLAGQRGSVTIGADLPSVARDHRWTVAPFPKVYCLRCQETLS